MTSANCLRLCYF